MILDEFVKIKSKGNSKINFYKKLGYNTKDIDFEVSIKDLLPTSKVIIKAKCDFCDNIVDVTYKNYYRNLNRSKQNKYACSRICAQQKVNKTNLEKWGFENANKSDIIKIKKKQTNLEKWGCEYTFQNEYIKNKIYETNLEKWGYANPGKSEVVKEKIKKTNLEKWGFVNPGESEVVKEKIRKTNLDRYGNIIFFKTDKFNNKIEEHKLEIKNTKVKLYGVDHHMKSSLYRENFNICKDKNYLFYLKDSVSLFKCEKGHNFEINSDNYRGRIINNTPLCTVCNPIGDSKSIKEKELFEFIKDNYSGEVIQSYRDVQEIDIYLPELKLGFEFNGLYWHSDLFKDKWYHINKTNYFRDKGIRIIHIWEDDWIFKNRVVKSQIMNWLGNSLNLFARKCKVINIDNCADFLNENHIQGNTNCNLKIGLLYNGELVSVMAFNKFEGRKKLDGDEWNLSRFCNKLNTSVIGGASKLLNYFIKNYKPSRIISYADKDWSCGELYYKLGFKNIYESKPDYKYFFNNRRKHKQNFKKEKIGIPSEISESNFMKNNGIHKVWDCGKIKFELINNNI